MAFPKSLLADHEKVIFELRPHWLSATPSALWTVLYLVAAWGAATVTEGNLRWVLVGLLTLAWVWLALVPFLRWRFTLFVLTSDRLITRSGVIAKHSKEIPLERINDVAFSQSVMERVFGAGDLMIESAGERGQTRIDNVRKPDQVQLTIYKEIESNTDRMMTPRSPATREPTIPEQIEALARLKDQGALTELEFETKKQELLKRL